MQYILPFDIWQEIILKCEFIDAIHLRQLNKWFYKLEIHDFYNIDDKYICKLTNDILIAYPFIRKLNAYNGRITNINHLTNLKVLYVDWNGGISDNGINKLTNLKELSYLYNNRLKNFECKPTLLIYGFNI